MGGMEGERIDLELLNDLLRQLGIPFVRARVSCSSFIFVRPNHERFWFEFKEKYPEWKRVAEELNATIYGNCPEFKQEEDLLIWLARVTGLPFIFCLV